LRQTDIDVSQPVDDEEGRIEQSTRHPVRPMARSRRVAGAGCSAAANPRELKEFAANASADAARRRRRSRRKSADAGD
jgi:hypothetical protein